MWPASIRLPPNQISATEEMLMVSVVTGSINACQRPAASAVSANRCWRPETGPARPIPGERPITRNAGELSRSTWFMRRSAAASGGRSAACGE